MTRKKRVRKGAAGEAVVIVGRNRTQSDIEGRLRKKMKKRKGLRSGNRHSEAKQHEELKNQNNKDPRLGSKKPIQLVVTEPVKTTKQERRLSAEKELELLENDTQLNTLLDRLDKGEKLGSGLQAYVDEKLDRIELLMSQLGLFDEEEDSAIDEPAQSKSNEKADDKLSEEDRLLNQFSHSNFDDIK